MIKNKIGVWGEIFAARYLRDNGYDILSSNYVCRFGELDLVAVKDETVCFVEVKTRTTLSYGHPFESINAQKLSKMQKAAFYYLEEKIS